MLTTILRINLVFNINFLSYFNILQSFFDKDNCKFLLIFRYYSSKLII